MAWAGVAARLGATRCRCARPPPLSAPMPGGRLTEEDRQHIAAGLAKGLGYTEIGRRLGRPASRVMREVTRNGGPDDYRAGRAGRAGRAHEATQHRARRPKQARPPSPPIPDSGHGRDPRGLARAGGPRRAPDMHLLHPGDPHPPAFGNSARNGSTVAVSPRL
ncbi:hypothetical protein GCM10017771_47170 [Streptomyces capitiformicae]|uniref:Transposase IS30-like HTH domain-containing protein n=2 Tax=Streptomyces capitiformicae TaxID=2014920 RepID=A0A919DCN2_9ACTN|nr:hypothetical protein GCM10017771_47170 [Streptomyces capitiformicae]